MASEGGSGVHVSVPALAEDPQAALLPVLHLVWPGVSEADVELWQISGALTNIIFRCENLLNSQFVLVRVFGNADALFSREEEQEIFGAVARAGLGPRLLASFGNGRVEEFLLDQSISAAEMCTPAIAACVATALASFHFSSLSTLRPEPARGGILWGRLRAWRAALDALYAPQELTQLGLAATLEEVALLEASLPRRHPCPVGFGHNDAQAGNMLLHTAAPRSLSFGGGGGVGGASPPRGSSPLGGSPRGGSPRGMSPSGGASPPWQPRGSLRGFSSEELQPETAEGELVSDLVREAVADALGESPRGRTRERPPPRGRPQGGARDLGGSQKRLSVRLIDYEYAGMTPVAFDIANHWCEYAADYHAPVPSQLHFERLPSRQHRELFLRAYLRTAAASPRYEALTGACWGGESSTPPLTVAALLAAAEAYLAASHLLWGLWGLLQARASPVEGFDYAHYARQRLAQYAALKGPLLADAQLGGGPAAQGAVSS